MFTAALPTTARVDAADAQLRGRTKRAAPSAARPAATAEHEAPTPDTEEQALEGPVYVRRAEEANSRRKQAAVAREWR